MDKKFMLTQNNEASYYDTLEQAIAEIKYDDAEVWERDSYNCFIKIYF